MNGKARREQKHIVILSQNLRGVMRNNELLRRKVEIMECVLKTLPKLKTDEREALEAMQATLVAEMRVTKGYLMIQLRSSNGNTYGIPADLLERMIHVYVANSYSVETYLKDVERIRR